MAGQMPVYQAAEMLRVSERQVKRILAAYREEGVDALSTGIVDAVADVNTKADGGNRSFIWRLPETIRRISRFFTARWHRID